MASSSDQITDAVISNAIFVLRYEESVRREIVGMLVDLKKVVVEDVADIDVGGTTRLSWKKSRIDRLLAKISAAIDSTYTAMAGVLSEALKEIAAIVSGSLRSLADRILKIVRKSPPRSTVKTVADLLIEGSPASQWWSRQAQGLKMAFAREVWFGYGVKETNAQILDRILGRKVGAGRVGGIINVSAVQAEKLIATAIQTMKQKVVMDLVADHDDLFDGVEAIAILDERTSLLCISRDGGAWDIESGEPLERSTVRYKFPGPPPWHWACRTDLIPVLAGSDKRTRQTYEEWLKTKTDDFQIEVLGPRRYDLWKQGKIKAAQLVNQRGNPLTLDRLRMLTNSSS